MDKSAKEDWREEWEDWKGSLELLSELLLVQFSRIPYPSLLKSSRYSRTNNILPYNIKNKNLQLNNKSYGL
jgi:hypothetical protein